jgi:hypothetical protein
MRPRPARGDRDDVRYRWIVTVPEPVWLLASSARAVIVCAPRATFRRLHVVEIEVVLEVAFRAPSIEHAAGGGDADRHRASSASGSRQSSMTLRARMEGAR